MINPQSQCCAINRPVCGGNSHTCAPMVGESEAHGIWLCKLPCAVAVPMFVLMLPLLAL